jgi:hypothetical protein
MTAPLRRKLFREHQGFRGRNGPFVVAIYVLKPIPRVPLPDVPPALDANGRCGWDEIAALQSHVRQHQWRMQKARWAALTIGEAA